MNKGIGYASVGEAIDSFMLIKEASKGLTSGGKPFLTLILRDATGEIEAKLWDATKEDEALFIPEKIIKVSGEVNQFRGKPQLKILAVRPAQPTDDVHVSDFVEKAPVSKDILMDKLTEAIFEMKNPTLQRITRAFIKKYQENLLLYPAATKNHHEYVSGLAHHIVSMLGIARQIHQLYPEVNKDLLYAGIILHDLGKLRELSGMVTTSYTIEGKLLGHIPIMVEEIGLMARELQIEGEEEILILQHLILSHHGKAEWGSPKPPLVREAEILHLIDLMDAKMNMLNRALDKVKPGEFTDRLFAMDNRAFYKPSFEE
ncbi:3'-5' exoribonuclease YhaM [Oceanobacillus picturae]|jgi:3'-5' exoribonuclease|uniref:3'-5' exoribonuclease YhaM n=2 Tax=Oceanobacillus TaxID=182709 RepID=W9AIK2_9BACI|nr:MULTISPECIES: 3'-5' exoribonuclease YhaM [Oceanobacillus]AVQ98577.1 3'-5' exoribonuclease YhaM [Oceanobacillus iheyensis]NAP00544.1 3'-5' exoribonuclease YhaM [Halomonas sp. MG34]MCG3418481.1 3'-5' exoribonuclease YhaM [Oceanobacillus jordanicus]RIU90651.1 3'-5' exoribonuclease YhaM [Oceanobacillus picturae]CDO02747.1 3'-5' exoribonuclease YhaM [Oceanobacillus picturae]